MDNYIESGSKEITSFNYQDLIIDSYDQWFLQAYQTDKYYCQTFGPFWEEVYPQYPFLNFGRINIEANKSLISKLPFGIKGFPFVYFQEKNKEPHFAEIFMERRGGVTNQLKEFVF